MSKLNEGVVFTNSNCIGCNRCVASCPVPGTCVCITNTDKHHIEVNGDKCIHCGQCFNVCKHNAREYHDDTRAFFDALKRKDKISLIIDPSFYLLYPKLAPGLIGFLKKSGVAKVYDAAYGADIATWCQLQYMETHDFKGGISASCPVIENYMKYYNPGFLQKLIPIASPAMCTAVYARKYLKDTAKFAFLGSCIARKDENSLRVGAHFLYNITYAHLFEYLKDVDFTENPQESDLVSNGLGCLCGMNGGYKECLEQFLVSDEVVLQMENSIRAFRVMDSTDIKLAMESEFPLVAQAQNCAYGCVLGTGAPKGVPPFAGIVENYRKLRASIRNTDGANPFSKNYSSEKRLELLNKQFAALSMTDFLKTCEEQYIQPIELPEDAYEEIFTSMHKITQEERNVDCQKCGYQNCREMVKAIALGYNRMEDCIFFAQEENQRLLMTDTLTGIPNANAFNTFVMKLISEHKCVGYTAIFFNIKNFTLVNERYGFEAGDDAILEFSNQVYSYAIKDEMVARMSDDNYKAVIHNQNVASFLERVNSVTLHIGTQQGTDEYPVNIRAGIFVLKGDETIPGDVSGKISLAYSIACQNETKDFAYYDDVMRRKMMDSKMLGRMLPQALKKKEFVIYFQPKVDIETHHMVGAEALVRWRRGEELISPAHFIPIAEKNGTITQIDFYVLEYMCRKMREWMEKGIPLVKISSNFSKQHFLDEYIAEKICHVVDRYHVPHEFVEVEFTETAYIDEQEKLENTIAELHKMGFSSSMDDFGTGYSSLSLLQNLDFEVLKLDKSLLGEGVRDKRTQKVISSVIRMAKDLDLEVIAEGVETPEELQMLKDSDCDMIQGYLFDRPLPEDEFEKRLQNVRYDRR